MNKQTQLIYIKPLSGYIIRRNTLSPKKEYVLDKLNSDLSFKKTVAKAEPEKNLDQAKQYFILTNQVKPGGWIKVEEKYSMQEMMKAAMKELRNKVKEKA